MRGRKIFREPVDPYLAPAWQDSPEPDYIEPKDPCALCRGEGAIGTGFSGSFVDASDAMPCPVCGGTGEQP